MHRWEGSAHEAEHERISRELLRHSRAIEGMRLSPEERRALQSAAARMLTDEALSANRARQAPVWRDRRALATLGVQAIVAVVATLALLHSINPALP